MKTKVSLTIDKDLLPKSKKFAEKSGISLSQLVEALLRRIVEKDSDSSTFSERWRGKFSLQEKEEARFKKLKNRYDL